MTKLRDQKGWLRDAVLKVETGVLLSVLNHRVYCEEVGDVQEAISHFAGYQVLMADLQFSSQLFGARIQSLFPEFETNLGERTEAECDVLLQKYTQRFGVHQDWPGQQALPKVIMHNLRREGESMVKQGIDDPTSQLMEQHELLVHQLQSTDPFRDRSRCPLCGEPLAPDAMPSDQADAERRCQSNRCRTATEPRTPKAQEVAARRLLWNYQKLLDTPEGQQRLIDSWWLVEGTIHACQHDAGYVAAQPTRNMALP